MLNILSYIPAIISVIKSMEDAVPGKGLGVQRLDAVKQILIALNLVTPENWSTISKIITVLVALFNATSWGKASAPVDQAQPSFPKSSLAS